LIYYIYYDNYIYVKFNRFVSVFCKKKMYTPDTMESAVIIFVICIHLRHLFSCLNWTVWLYIVASNVRQGSWGGGGGMSEYDPFVAIRCTVRYDRHLFTMRLTSSSESKVEKDWLGINEGRAADCCSVRFFVFSRRSHRLQLFCAVCPCATKLRGRRLNLIQNSEFVDCPAPHCSRSAFDCVGVTAPVYVGYPL